MVHGTIRAGVSFWLLLIWLTTPEISICVAADHTNPTDVTLLLQLPDLNPDALPTSEFINHVNSAQNALRTSGRDTRVQIIAKSMESRTYARIILLSFGLKMSLIASSESIQSASFRKGDKIITIENPTRTHETRPEVSDNTNRNHTSRRTALIVLGNAPLDASTPTIDLIKRTLKAVDYAKANPGSYLVLTGGQTKGPISESKMMAVIALSHGIPQDRIFMEEKAMGTLGNAKLTKPIVVRLSAEEVFVVTKHSHMEWALPLFREQGGVFANAKALACNVTEEEIIQQMKEYLSLREDDSVRSRMEALRNGAHGVD